MVSIFFASDHVPLQRSIDIYPVGALSYVLSSDFDSFSFPFFLNLQLAQPTLLYAVVGIDYY